MTTYPKLPQHIDSTMRACFRSCPQKFFLEFVHGFRPPGISIDLHAGGVFASAVEEVYRQVFIHKRPMQDALNRARLKFFAEWGDVEPPAWNKMKKAKNKDRVWTAVEGDGTPEGRGYFEQYGIATDEIQPYFDANGKPTLEYSFAVPLEPYSSTDNGHCFPEHPDGGPFIYTGRFDMLGIRHGDTIVKDDKTTGGSIGAYWSEQWELRAQFLGYCWALQQCGIPCNQVAVRGIAIQQTQIVHIEAIKTYSNFLIARWHEQLRRDLWNLRRMYNERYWDFNLSDACSSYGGCIFSRVCQSPNPESWCNEFEVRHWNPIAKNPIEAKP